MKHSLLWKLISINVLSIGFVIVIVWVAVDLLAAEYFVELMKEYNISPVSSHRMFVDSVHRYLEWATVAAIALTIVLSVLLMKRALGPLTRMAEITRRIAAGDYSKRAPIRSEDEVGRLAVSFNAMAESLERVEQLRRDLMINVAHELRTPLTNIQGYLEGLLDGVVPASKETYELLLEESLRLADLVESILRLAKADAARAQLHKEEVDVADMIHQALETFGPQLAEKEIEVDENLGSGEIRVSADQAKLRQVIDNLLQNAVQYTDRGGTLKVSAHATAENAEVVFTNAAGHLTELDLPFLFERFYRGEKSRSREHGGAGIGLAVVKELIHAHNGRVSAQLSDGEIRILFTLPK